ncbi:MAG: hypothetical protein QXN63_03880 [Candidatus Bathyarchaeia archaeon]
METKEKNVKAHLNTRDLVLISILSAYSWLILHLTIGPFGFAFFNLPILCDVAAYFTLILTVWIIGKFGAASLVGIIGSLLVLLLRPGAFHILGFTASAILFDALCFTIRHNVFSKTFNIVIVSAITVFSAYFAGVVIGLLFMARPLEWALTYWGVLHAAGGALSLFIAFPVLGALEKANVRKLK